MENGWLEPSPATGSPLTVQDVICNIGESKGCMPESLVLQHCPLPQALGSSSSCSLMLYWGDYVFLLTITFPRDRGGQHCDQKAFLLPCIPADARLSPQKWTSSQSPAGTQIDH